MIKIIAFITYFNTNSCMKLVGSLDFDLIALPNFPLDSHSAKVFLDFVIVFKCLFSKLFVPSSMAGNSFVSTDGKLGLCPKIMIMSRIMTETRIIVEGIFCVYSPCNCNVTRVFVVMI